MSVSPVLYIGWRKSLPRIRYLEIFSGSFSKFNRAKSVAQNIRLRRYQRSSEGGQDVLLRYISSGFYMGVRLLQLQAIFLPAILTSPVLCFDGREMWYRLLVRCLRAAGPTFIKLGQWAATRPDLLPLGLCRILGELHSRAPEHSLAWTRTVFRRSFNAELEDVFSHFEEMPVGSGSVAQVHRATSLTGQELAVKVLHPGVEEQFKVDLQLLSLAANIIHRIPPLSWLHVPEEIKYFSHVLQDQLDLRFEAYTLSRFRRNFTNNPSVSFPEPVASARQILIESYEEGLPVSFFTRKQCGNPAWSAIKKEIATTGLQSFMQMLLWDNFVHADLHPGNMLIKFPGYTKPITSATDACQAYEAGFRPSIVYLDTGLITELSSKDFTNFTDLFKALVFHADGELAGRLMIERSPGDSASHVIDAPGFCHGLEELVRPIFSHRRSETLMHLEHFSISPLIFQTFDLVREHHVRLEGAFTNLVMSLICVEGLGRELTPQLSLRPLLLSAGLQYLATNIARTVTETVEPYI